MAYTAKSYDHLKGGAVQGLSDALLDQHFTLYKGYINKLNEMRATGMPLPDDLVELERRLSASFDALPKQD